MYSCHTHRLKPFKVCLLGEPGVGKTSLFNRLKFGHFVEKHQSTIGYEFCSSTFHADNEVVTLEVWDTGGQERYRSLTNGYCRNADLVLLMYSLSDPTSLSNLPTSLEALNQCVPRASRWGRAVKVLIGNKCDLPIEVEEGSEKMFRRENKCDLKFRISAKTGEGVEEAFQFMCQFLLKATPLDADGPSIDETDGYNPTKTLSKNGQGPKQSENNSCRC